MAKKKKDIVWFGMKLSPEQKRKVELLAEKKGTTQKDAIMNLVEEELVDYAIDTTSGSILEKLQDYAGKINGPEDLSTNKKYLDDFGKNRTD